MPKFQYRRISDRVVEIVADNGSTMCVDRAGIEAALRNADENPCCFDADVLTEYQAMYQGALAALEKESQP